MSTIKQEQQFREQVIPIDLLDQSIAWISDNMDPEDVFTTDNLKKWAQVEGIGEVFEEKDIIEQAQSIGLEEVFTISILEEWAKENGYIK